MQKEIECQDKNMVQQQPIRYQDFGLFAESKGGGHLI
jgi:hypothetical protein